MTPSRDPDQVQTSVPETGPVLGARFRVICSLGRGAMGDVYLAEDTKLHRRVAIKRIRADHQSNAMLLQRIKRECLLHARIGAHPHIVTLFDLLDGENQLLIVMEYVEGESLEALLMRHRDEGPILAPAECVEIALQCLDALSHTHKHGIIHRDIKPANVILDGQAPDKLRAKLMDFGIARMLVEDPDSTTLTLPGTRSPGTPLYMAPEQIDSETYGAVTPAADIYAVGVMLYDMLAGRPPFAGTITDIFNGHLNLDPKPIALPSDAALDPALWAVVSKAMAKRPADRYTSAEAFAAALKPFMAASWDWSGTGPRRARLVAGLMQRAGDAWKRHRARAGLAAAAAGVGIAGTLLFWNPAPGGVERPMLPEAPGGNPADERPASGPEPSAVEPEPPPVAADTRGAVATADVSIEPPQAAMPDPGAVESGPAGPDAAASGAGDPDAGGGDMLFPTQLEAVDPATGRVIDGGGPVGAVDGGVRGAAVWDGTAIARGPHDGPGDDRDPAFAASELVVAHAGPDGTGADRVPGGDTQADALAGSDPERYGETPEAAQETERDDAPLIVADAAAGGETPAPDTGEEGAPEPASLEDRTYVVQAGDTLHEIAVAHGLAEAELIRWNRLRDPDALYVGQQLYLYERPDLEPLEEPPPPAPESAPDPESESAPDDDPSPGQVFKEDVKEIFDKTKKGIRNLGRKLRGEGK